MGRVSLRCELKQGFRNEKEITSISNNDKTPSFENTIAEIERSGELLTKVTAVFYNLLSADTNDDLDKLSEKIGPKLSAHRDSLFLNEKIFKRLKSIKTNEYSSLSSEQQRLTDEMIRNFEMNGANLSEQSKERFIEINNQRNKFISINISVALRFSRSRARCFYEYRLFIRRT